MAICNSFLNEKDDALVEAAQRGEFSGIQSCTPEQQEAWEKAAPATREAIAEKEREFNEKWQEIEKEFPKIEEVLGAEVEKSSVVITSGEKWDLDRFEKDGFGPYVKQPPDFEKLFPEVKIKEKPEVKFGTKGQQILAETDRATGTDTKIYEPRSEQEIKEKELQILREISPPQVTPEETAILKELRVASDVEKMQRELIREQSKVHDYGHHIISPEMQGEILTSAQLDKWRRIYEECKESGKFITQSASQNWEEFFCENLRVFFTHPEWVKEESPKAYHEIDKIVTHLTVLEYMRD